MAPYDVLVDPQTLPSLPKDAAKDQPTADDANDTDKSSEVGGRRVFTHISAYESQGLSCLKIKGPRRKKWSFRILKKGITLFTI